MSADLVGMSGRSGAPGCAGPGGALDGPGSARRDWTASSRGRYVHRALLPTRILRAGARPTLEPAMTEQGTSSRVCHLRAWPEAWGLARAGADMTANRRSKRAVRSRMAQTGEKYTDARRALVAAGGHSGGAGEGPGGVITWPADSLGAFTHHAYTPRLLAC